MGWVKKGTPALLIRAPGRERDAERMFHPKSPAKCRVVKKVTDQNTFYCLKPAQVSVALHTPEPLVLCLDCARELAKEVIDSVPGGGRDSSRGRK